MKPAEHRLELMALTDAEARHATTNPKQHDIDKVIDSYLLNGFVEVPAIDETTGRFVAGHGRIEALRVMKDRGDDPPKRIIVKDGEWFFPVLRGISFESDDHAEAYLLASNQTTIGGGWDTKPLHDMLESMQKRNAEAFQGSGFTADAFKDVQKRYRVEFFANRKADDVPPGALPAKPITAHGDEWILGRHRLWCRPCADLPDILGKRLGDILVTDPPYGVGYVGKTGDALTLDNDQRAPERMSELWAEWFTAIRPCLRNGAAFYVCGPSQGDLGARVVMALAQADMAVKHTLIWCKNAMVLGRADYHYQHEPISYGWIPNAPRQTVDDRTQTSTWHIDRPSASKHHPTMKPVELYARAYRNSASPGDLALDPFAGSGTCYIAAEQLDLRCYGMETDPAYCDVIVERWQTLTGKKARRKKRSARAQSKPAKGTAANASK